MPSSIRNLAIIAAAGSRKTEQVVDAALAATSGRVLITTFTNWNQDQIVRRIEQKAGRVPSHVTVMGWFSFLISHCVKPYQQAITKEPLVVKGLNFKGQRNMYTKKSSPSYFVDREGDLYRDGVSDFAASVNERTNGAVINRLERVFTHIFIDEVQDLVGYDLELLDLLMKSRIQVMLVGDPRQHTFSTNVSRKNSRFRGMGLVDWLKARSGRCQIVESRNSYRCCQAICNFADAIYPTLPSTIAIDVSMTGHDGVFQVCANDLRQYVSRFSPVTILRYDRTYDTLGLPAMNIGVVKGSTFDRIVIFPTKPMMQYLRHGDPSQLKSPEKLYVAVTRARFSAAFVVPDPLPCSVPVYRPETVALQDAQF
jgi:DNA helicase II / ATP-dependent DNA helicase PcrA